MAQLGLEKAAASTALWPSWGWRGPRRALPVVELGKEAAAIGRRRGPPLTPDDQGTTICQPLRTRAGTRLRSMSAFCGGM